MPHGQHDLAFGEKIAGNLPLDVGGDLYWRRELRTPLTPVLFAPSILSQDPTVPERLREELKIIARNVELEAR